MFGFKKESKMCSDTYSNTTLDNPTKACDRNDPMKFSFSLLKNKQTNKENKQLNKQTIKTKPKQIFKSYKKSS